MKISNPLVIPRNHKVEEVLNEANKNNLEPMNKLIKAINKPYTKQKEIEKYQKPSYLNEKYQTFCGT